MTINVSTQDPVGDGLSEKELLPGYFGDGLFSALD